MPSIVAHSAVVLVAVLCVMVAAPAMAAWTDSVQAKTSASAGTLMAPDQLSCNGTTGGGTLSWGQVPGATGYEVIGPLGSLGTLLDSALSLVNGVLSYTLPAVSLGQYKVRAVLQGTTWKSAYSIEHHDQSEQQPPPHLHLSGRIDKLAPVPSSVVPLPIRQIGDPVLRTRADRVTEFGPELAELADQMFASMYAARGVGLAANQIGIGLSIFVMDCEGVKAVVINSRIVSTSEETVTDEEGCLSVVGKNYPTARAAEATVEGQDLTGAPISLSGAGEVARCLQHETDHLSGRLYLDRLKGAVRRQARREVELG